MITWLGKMESLVKWFGTALVPILSFIFFWFTLNNFIRFSTNWVFISAFINKK